MRYAFLTKPSLVIAEYLYLTENVELKNDELTLKGFLDLNQLEAEDSGNDTEDLWANLTGMGFNKALQMDEVSHI